MARVRASVSIAGWRSSSVVPPAYPYDARIRRMSPAATATRYAAGFRRRVRGDVDAGL
ncbi:hypothetical protein ABZV60_35615 [Streptomyces sp. NPDC004787]|uniref:hypothetical protein n=1 Tax=Streptomyces sp. NPDC004787 TaxID=3154291 RepID=UPI0033A556A7